MTIAREDYSFGRPSRREGEALLPALHSGQVELVLVLDTSGSINHQDFREFVAEIDALKGQIRARVTLRSEEHTSELQSLMRISYAVICLKKKKQLIQTT